MIRSLVAALLLLTVFSSKCSGQDPLNANITAPVETVVQPADPNMIYTSDPGCEGSATALSCAKPGLVDKVIQVVSVTYGRTSETVCTNHVPKLNKNTNCVPTIKRTKINTGKVQVLCDNRKTCIVHASNYIFGDTCVGTHKYVIVKYKCVAADCKNTFDSNSCDKYAANGQCFINPGWMFPMCQKSCTKDCNTDCKNIGQSDKICDRRALEGQCIRPAIPYNKDNINEKRMHAICPLSCKACPPRSQGCRNIKGDLDCGTWAAKGECQNPLQRLWMYRKCSKACGVCRCTV